MPLDWSVFVHCFRSTPRCLSFSDGTSMVQMSIVLLVAGDIEVNPGPVNFGFGNYRSIRNKDPSISGFIPSSDIDILGLTETHIRVNDTPSFINDIILHGYALFHRPCHGNT